MVGNGNDWQEVDQGKPRHAVGILSPVPRKDAGQFYAGICPPTAYIF